MRGDVHVRFGGRERGNGTEETRSPRPLPTRHLSFDARGADLLYQVFNKRYQRASTIVTTNLPFKECGKLFHNNAAASTIAERLVHRGILVQVTGTSYRLKNTTSTD